MTKITEHIIEEFTINLFQQSGMNTFMLQALPMMAKNPERSSY